MKQKRLIPRHVTRFSTFRQSACAFCCFVALALPVSADQSSHPPPAGTPQSIDAVASMHAGIAQAVVPSVVQVNYTLRYDGTEEPVSRGWNERCPNCGNYHGDRVEPLVKEERPLERPGFLISPTRVVTAHMMIHPRFVEKVTVSFGGQTVDARPVAYGIEQRGVILELDQPLQGAKPLDFSASGDDELFFITVQESGGQWNLGVQPFAVKFTMGGDGSLFLNSLPETVIVNASGQAVAVSMTETLPHDGSWRVAPSEWRMVSANEMDELLKRQAEGVAKFLPRVSLGFRSPREAPEEHRHRRHSRDEDVVTEMEVPGLVLDDGLVLVLTGLTPSTTARLERIRVHIPGRDTPVAAHFVASLTDYGAFVAQMEASPEGVAFSEMAMDSLQGQLVLATELEIKGEQLHVHHEPIRIVDLQKGRRGVRFPDLAGSTSNMYLCDREGALIALPIEFRDRSVGQERRWRTPQKVLAPASVLLAVLEDIDSHSDHANVPLDASEEGRLAWVGVELQPLDAGLARDLRVAAETDSGDTGALVTHVYPSSPAATAGIETGDVLLRVVSAVLPRPFPVKIEPDSFGGRPFPWDQLDQVPDQYFSYLPMPWVSVANAFNSFLTELGFDQEVRIEGMRDGQPIQFQLTVVRGPVHYEAAPQHRLDDIGLTLRELTFETRRFFQMDEDSPGLIVARIEPGSPASTGGLKPFEVITHVNGDPVFTAEELKTIEESAAQYQFSVQRMHQGRIVLIRSGEDDSSE